MIFETKNPENIAFSGLFVADDQLPWVLNSAINYMFVNRSELYHQKNDPISYYSPTTVSSNIYSFKDNTSYPFVAGNGIAIQFVTESGNDGYVKITNTLSSATVPVGSTGTFSLYGANQQFKLLQVASPLVATESNNVVTIAGPNLATSQSVSSSLLGYFNSINPFSDGSELVYLTNSGSELNINQTQLKNKLQTCITTITGTPSNALSYLSVRHTVA